MKTGTFFGVLFSTGATAADYVVIREGCRVLSLTGAGKALSDIDFYWTLVTYGAIALVVSLVGLILSNRLGLDERHPAVTFWLVVTALVPFGMYVAFRRLW